LSFSLDLLIPLNPEDPFTQTIISEYQITADDRLLQFASINFDVAVEEIYPSLCTGATLVIRNDDMLSDLRTFFQA
jgi:non-ribosomal peptide synthetase component F